MSYSVLCPVLPLILLFLRNNITENVAIEGQNLTFSITTRQGRFIPILKDCSISAPSRQFWILLGPNGCGKSTLLKILAGLLKPTGRFLYVKKPMSFVFQNPDHQGPINATELAIVALSFLFVGSISQLIEILQGLVNCGFTWSNHVLIPLKRTIYGDGADDS